LHRVGVLPNEQDQRRRLIVRLASSPLDHPHDEEDGGVDADAGINAEFRVRCPRASQAAARTSGRARSPSAAAP
jgi:hypothetical protein